MKNLPIISRTLAIIILTFTISHAVAQQIDQETFCTGITTIFRAMTQDPDEMKGKFVGVNSKGVEQWEVKHMLPYAVSGVYEFESSLQDYFRAGFIMSQSIPPYMAESFYRQVVNAVEECFGRQYVLYEKVDIQTDSKGQRYEQFEGTFKYSGTERGFNSTPPEIIVRSFAVQRESFIVSVDFLSLYTKD